MQRGGAYTAARASALSGVPQTTIHYWAREGIVVPSVSAQRVKLWSYQDLLALRTVYWLRQRKTASTGHEIPATAMRTVRQALDELRSLDLETVGDDGEATLVITPDGQVLVREPGSPPRLPTGQGILPEVLDVIAPFSTLERTRGVDLRAPAEHVRILPRRLAGAPHVSGTRIDTESLAALRSRGFDDQRILALYPELSAGQLADALSVEAQLAENLRIAA